jgi:nucleoid-associated protein EbfC
VSFESEPEEGMGPGFGLGDLLSQVQEMQEKLASAQAEAAERVVQGRAGSGAVVVSVSGGLEFRGVKIDPSLLVDGDVTLVEDLVLAALRDAMERVSELNREAIAHSGLEDLAELDDLGVPGMGAMPLSAGDDADGRDFGSLSGVGDTAADPDDDGWDDSVR